MHLVNNLYPVRTLLRNLTGYAPSPLAHVGQDPRTEHTNQGEDNLADHNDRFIAESPAMGPHPTIHFQSHPVKKAGRS